ncbi:Copine C-terminal domain-containing protein [Plasmodiophora brassicae]|uniref:Copine C-terminal domain-containing protein n=1 Tax=Plasmodiophora brassicae TaxID=37360 RepID=A0A0G4IJN9_PLABS|nr:hypothetical protein PBRA_004061 [Plasmodiophora brassicae]
MQANLTAMLHNPGTLTAKLQSPVEETLDTAEVKLEIARINRTFALFEYLSAGMTLDVTVAVDLSKANGDQSDPKSLHFLDPKGADPSCYAGNMKAAVEMLEPYACRIFPLGFNGTLPKETASEGAFQLCRVRPSGVVDSWAQLSTCYQNVIPGVALGAGPSMAAPLVSRVVQSSVPFSSEKQTYSVLVIFTNSVPKDLSAFKASVQESSSHPVSVIVVGVLPRNFSPSSKHAFQPLARLAKSLRGRDGLDGRNNFQFVAALNESRQACRSMMAELEAQILAYVPRRRWPAPLGSAV